MCVNHCSERCIGFIQKNEKVLIGITVVVGVAALLFVALSSTTLYIVAFNQKMVWVYGSLMIASVIGLKAFASLPKVYHFESSPPSVGPPQPPPSSSQGGSSSSHIDGRHFRTLGAPHRVATRSSPAKRRHIRSKTSMQDAIQAQSAAKKAHARGTPIHQQSHFWKILPPGVDFEDQLAPYKYSISILTKKEYDEMDESLLVSKNHLFIDLDEGCDTQTSLSWEILKKNIHEAFKYLDKATKEKPILVHCSSGHLSAALLSAYLLHKSFYHPGNLPDSLKSQLTKPYVDSDNFSRHVEAWHYS